MWKGLGKGDRLTLGERCLWLGRDVASHEKGLSNFFVSTMLTEFLDYLNNDRQGNFCKKNEQKRSLIGINVPNESEATFRSSPSVQNPQNNPPSCSPRDFTLARELQNLKSQSKLIAKLLKYIV